MNLLSDKLNKECRMITNLKKLNKLNLALNAMRFALCEVYDVKKLLKNCT